MAYSGGMDPVRAKAMTEELRGKTVGGWTVVDLAGQGKSAVVFEATRAGTTGALKVFDRELVERFGKDVQMRRLHRELRLVGQDHPNLVPILDGGEDPNFAVLFIAMGYIKFKNLAETLDRVPRERIWPLIAQVAKAAQYLETLELCHRDIKPDNIAVSPDFEQAVLLDLGVLRPFGSAREPPMTDLEQLHFVGTLQYASPEFLARAEDDSPEGWRSLTFYQLGAVLHDLIMRERIFAEDADPFARLTYAIKDKQPVIAAEDVSPDLVLLARNCLQKEPKLRLRFVSWGDFAPKSGGPSTMDLQRRIRSRMGTTGGDRPPMPDWQVQRDNAVALRDLARRLDNAIRDVCINTGLPPATIREVVTAASNEAFVIAQFAASAASVLSGSLEIGFRVRLIDSASVAVQIDALAAMVSTTVDLTQPGGATSPVFEGTFEDGVVRAVLGATVLTVFDAAQQTGTIAEPVWLLGGPPKQEQA